VVLEAALERAIATAITCVGERSPDRSIAPPFPKGHTMEVFTAIDTRRSVRTFTPEEVPDEVLQTMAEAALKAPSISGAPLVGLVAVKRADRIQRMAHSVAAAVAALDLSDAQVHSAVTHFSTFFGDAPALLAFTRRPYTAVIDDALTAAQGHDHLNATRGYPDLLSVGAAVQNALLAATALGFHTCWLSAPLIARPALEAIMGIALPWQLAALVAVGRGAASPKARPELDLAARFRIEA